MKTKIVPVSGPVDRVVRVAVSNNFNCTAAEFNQLDKIAFDNPSSSFFVNCNIKTLKLLNLNRHPYPAAITVNPDLDVDRELVNRLDKIDYVAFVRVKWVPDCKEINKLIQDLNKKFTVVVTVQRFNGLSGLLKYSSRDFYEFSYNRFRINERSKLLLDKATQGLTNTYICDKAGLGCLGCGLCSKLTTGSFKPIYSLNLSSSGLCGFNCESCYAKAMQVFLKGCGYNLISYDKIKKNSKQKGITKHIQDKQKEATHELV